MNFLKRYKLVILIVLLILILVIIRSINTNHFRSDAKRWAEPSFIRTNIINEVNLDTMPGDKIIINLDDKTSGINNILTGTINIPADSVLAKNNINMIREHKGPVILISTQPSVSARVWMVLSQLGCNNIYIFTNASDNEVIKYKFRPDTMVRPEF